MIRALLVVIGFTLLLGACTQRMICPAYQSAFIYDKDQLRKKFSYFVDDSTPKVYTASKTKYLIAEPTPYRKKLRRIQTVEMKKVFVEVPDSLDGSKSDSVITADLDAAARSVIDSTFIVDVPKDTVEEKTEDSVYVISKDREVRLLKYNAPDSLDLDPATGAYVRQQAKYYVEEVGFNTEQDNYMWYLRKSLVLPDVRLAKLAQSGSGGDAKESGGKKEKVGFLGFFKNLFKKKEKLDTDSAELELKPQKDEFDFIDTTEVAPLPVIPQDRKQERAEQKQETMDQQSTDESAPKKKRRRRQEEAKPEEKPAEEPKKEEQQDDGF